MQKAIVKNLNPISDEVFYYKYNTSSIEPVSVKGYKNGKLIYTESCIYKKDTQEVNTNYINVGWMKGKEKFVTYYSKDSLVKTEITFRSNLPDTVYTTTKYNQQKGILEKIDSSRGNYIKVFYMHDAFGRVVKENTIDNNKLSEHCYQYDTNGRLVEETKSVDNTLTYLIKHDSLMRETITSEYYIQSNKKRDTASIIVKRFDTQGHLIFEETVMYLNEGIIGMPSKPVSTSVRYWMYEKGRIVKYMYRKSEDDPIITYDVTYQD